jgi:cleavage and polyadenylation specificity factor subunit 2
MLRITPVYGSSSFLPDNVDNEANNNNVDVDDDNNDDPPEWLASPGPSCTLIEYAGCRLLLNVGWDESMLSSMVLDQTEEVNSSSVSATKKGRGDDDGDDDNDGNNNNLQSTTKLPQDIDAVLICDSTLSSLGGLPLFYGNHHINSSSSDGTKNHDAKEEEGSDSSKTTKRMKLQQQHQQNNPPFLATYPTVKMGQMTMYDHHASLSLDGRDPGYTLEDVDTVFNTDAFITLKYSQTVYLPLMHGTNKKKKKTDTTDAMDMDYNNNEQDEDDELTKVRTNKNNGAPHKNATLAITPQLSGLVVGGCYWTLRRLSDDAMIVLAPTYHHAKERHLSGCTIHKFGINADALITMPGGPRGLLGQLYTSPPSTTSTTLQQQQRTTVSDDEGMIVTTKKKKTKKEIYADLINRRGPGRGNKPILSPPVDNRSESELVDSIMAALRRDGNVLLPVDASGRVLELLLILDRHWDRNRLSDAYNLCWIGPMCPNVIEYARAQLEWMSPPLGAQFDSQRGHPYGLRNVHLCTSVSEMETLIGGSKGGGGETMSNPTCVLASGATLDNGPARDLLLRWGGNPDNLVLLTDSTRCVPRGDVLYSRRRRRRHQHPFGEGSSTAAAAMRENPTLVRAQSSMDNSIIETVDGGSGPTTVATDTDDTDGNDDGQSAKFIGPPLTPDLVSNYTTSSQLLYQWCAAKAANEEMPDEVLVDAYVPHRAPLRGVELQEFLAEEEREVRLKKAEMEHLTMMKEIELARGRLRLGVGDADETTTTSGTSNTATTSSAVAATTASATTTTTSSRPKKKSRFDQALFIKFSKPVHSESVIHLVHVLFFQSYHFTPSAQPVLYYQHNL